MPKIALGEIHPQDLNKEFPLIRAVYLFRDVIPPIACIGERSPAGIEVGARLAAEDAQASCRSRKSLDIIIQASGLGTGLLGGRLLLGGGHVFGVVFFEIL